MPSFIRRALGIAAAASLYFATSAQAHTPPDPGPAPARIRPETSEGRELLAELIARSATAQRLVDHLEQSDVVVYVRYRWFATESINGHIGLMSSDPQHRYLIIELACRRTRLEQLVTLGHELRHAVEIADVPWVTDASSLSTLYRRIGEAVNVSGTVEAYESNAAAETSHQVRSELVAATALR
jgi:hypothetical protein